MIVPTDLVPRHLFDLNRASKSSTHHGWHEARQGSLRYLIVLGEPVKLGEPVTKKVATFLTKKVADVVNEEESDVVKKLRADLAAAQLDAVNVKSEALAAKSEVLVVKSAKKTRVPKGLYKTQCDDTMKKIKTTIKNIKDNHNAHREYYMLGLIIKDLIDDLPVSDDHESFKRWLTDNKEYIGLKKQSRKSIGTTAASPLGSENVSRATSVALVDESIEEGSTEDEYEDEEAGAA
jgi:hypothetical protein